MSTEKRKLTRAERKLIEAAIARANQTDKKQLSAQDSIPYQRMFPDGICRVTDTFYTKTIQYQDINYQLSQNEDKTAIFEGWCDFLNYFDSSIRFQLSFLNLTASRDSYANSINIPPQGDEFDSIRAEYTEMLQNQLAKGNNGLIKTKYLTFGIEATSLKAAKPRLERIETDVINNFKRLGVVVEPLNGKERLRVLHQIFHMDGQEPFQFSWDWLAPSGLSTKDFIAPSSFSFPNGKTFCMGKKFGAVSFVQILAPELNDRMLADFLDMESSLIVNLHIQSVDQVSAIKTIKRKITDLDRAKIEEQKKAVRSGYDMDIIPSDLATYGTEAKKLLQDLQSRNERMFLLTFLVLNTADNQRQLANNVFQASSIAQKHNCQLTRLDFQQEEGLMSSLPLGYNQIEIQRGLTTSSVAIFVPFTTQELFQDGREALYYGLNALSNNLIMVDRKLLKNPNGLILGTPGSGKSFSAKREISNVFLVTNDDVLICDPEDEYAPLVIRLGGQVVKISPTSNQYVNPMDINLNYSDDDNPLALKADFILSLCDIVVGSKDGLQPVEKTVIDRAVRNVYRPYHRTLNIGRVMSPTLALIVQREAEISAFKPVPFYTPVLDCGGFSAAGEKCAEKAAAQAVADACKGQPALVQTVEQKEKSEKPPALYDLTTLQRDANRQLGYTAQQTLDYLQALYEKKLCTYPRTDSRYLTADMEGTVPALAAAAAKICGVAVPDTVLAAQVCNSAKVTDHHAIVPTEGAGRADVEALPAGEREILRLVARELLCATGSPYRYQETAVTLDCGGNQFSAKGNAITAPGWKAYQREKADPAKESVLPDGLTEGMTLPVTAVTIKEGKTTAPKHYTEDTLLSAMETAGAKDMPEDAERKGIGTPATRAGILEKLVSTGFVERKKQKKATNLIPTQIGVSLITVLPEQLQSPLLTAEWEHQLKEVERGEVKPSAFMDGICNMLRDLVGTYKVIDGSQVLFPSDRETVGKCPRCGGAVTERKQGFFCENAGCRFVLWKNSKFFTAKKKNLNKSVAASLLKDGRVKLTGCYSEKTGKTYDATVVMEDTGEKTNFKLVFGNG